jgi:hypothetical protein
MTEVVVCWNCCVELHLNSDTIPVAFLLEEVERGSRSGSGRNRSGPVFFSSALNYILKLPPANPWTETANFCSDCAAVLTKIYKLV